MSNQGSVQQSVRDRHGQAGNRDWNGDWHELWDQEEIFATDDGTPEADRIPGSFNERMLKWINAELAPATYTNLPGAMQAYAESLDFYNWSSMTAIAPA